MGYKKLEIGGWRLLSKLTRITISTDPRLRPEEIENRLLLHRSFFPREESGVYFYLTEAEIYFFGCRCALPSELFLYGICHQDGVYQIKSSGMMMAIEGKDERKIFGFMEEELKKRMTKGSSKNFLGITEEEKALRLLQTKGGIYLFKPSSYDYRFLKAAS